MDWKDLLSSKIQAGELPEPEDSAPAAAEPASATKDSVRASVDRKGRRGKTAVIVEGFTCDDDTLRTVAATLKARLGTGGSARGGEILIQGDRLDDVRKILRELGYRVV